MPTAPRARRNYRWYDLNPRRLGGWFAGLVRALAAPLGKTASARTAAHTANRLAPIVPVHTPRGVLRFRCPSFTAARRATRFLVSEPETRAWLEEYAKPGDHMWDVGANVGLHALYACLLPGVTVTAFEPVPNTFAVLADNVAINGFGERASCLCLGLSDANAMVPIYLTDADAGTTMHALGAPVNVAGAFEAAGVVNVLTARGDELVARFGVTAPRHLKIDVDGHELRVLKGLRSLLPGVRSVWIEMLEGAHNADENSRIESLLTEAGFEKRHRAGMNQLFVKLPRSILCRASRVRPAYAVPAADSSHRKR
ncbi:MAG: FkbM family methyltransferase [Alphaproteobacteria bacterium]|nr:FkbM family methyltransferase [Alphaproteobacteria bacterium]